MCCADDTVEAPYPQYRCPVDGEDLPLTGARITVTCERHRPHEEPPVFAVRDATAADRHAIELICDRVWGETELDSFGATFDVLEGTNLIAEADGALAGLVSLALHQGEQAIVMLSVYPEFQGAGIGTALVREAIARTAATGLQVIKVATTNDDIPAFYFYQRMGFVIYEIDRGTVVDHHGAVLSGFAGIPIRDEIRLHRSVCP
ncbi:MAG TPA: GNAT family N-acetyltransferase [Coriobacteriia bacterium]